MHLGVDEERGNDLRRPIPRDEIRSLNKTQNETEQTSNTTSLIQFIVHVEIDVTSAIRRGKDKTTRTKNNVERSNHESTEVAGSISNDVTGEEQ